VTLLLLAGLALAGCDLSAQEPTVLATLTVDPTPTPTLSPGKAAMEAFVLRVLAGDLTYHAAFTGTVSGAANSIEVKGALDAAGADYQTATTYRFVGEPSRAVSVRYVDGKAWMKVDKARWARIEGFTPTDTNSLFAFITTARDVTFVKSETVAGKIFHHVAFVRSQPMTPDQIPADNLTSESVTRSKVDLVLDADGKPVSGSWRVEGRGRVSGQLQEILIQLELTFSKVGAKIVIKAP